MKYHALFLSIGDCFIIMYVCVLFFPPGCIIRILFHSNNNCLNFLVLENINANLKKSDSGWVPWLLMCEKQIICLSE